MEPTADLANAATGAADILVQLLLRQENLYLMVAVYALLTTIQKVLPPGLNEHHLAVRLQPLYPMILCSIGVWIPAQQPPDMSAGSKVLVGLILGWACGNLHKVWKQTVRGKDARIDAYRERKRVAAGTPTDPPEAPGA